MMKVIAGALCSHNYTREVGIGFKSHDLSGIFNHDAENSFFRNWRKHRQTGGYIWWDRMNMTAGYGVKFLIFEEVGKFLRELWVRDVDGKRCWVGFSKMNIRDGEHFLVCTTFDHLGAEKRLFGSENKIVHTGFARQRVRRRRRRILAWILREREREEEADFCYEFWLHQVPSTLLH